MTRPTFQDFKREAMQDPEFVKAYDALEEEYALIEEMIKARIAAKMSQQTVAEVLQTKQPAIARIESGSLKNITIATLKKIR